MCAVDVIIIVSSDSSCQNHAYVHALYLHASYLRNHKRGSSGSKVWNIAGWPIQIPAGGKNHE